MESPGAPTQRQSPPRCEDCGEWGHATKADEQCIYYGRAPEDHQDALPGDTIPHISQVHVEIYADDVLQTSQRRKPYWYEGQAVEVKFDGKYYSLGRASGDGCNCLIDSLRQVSPFKICGVNIVRAMLDSQHRSGPERIIPGDYLEIEFWADGEFRLHDRFQWRRADAAAPWAVTRLNP